ncbi:hypothetical protein FIBSPDRAFT_406300 [Athelia psychrophila]|uniref:Uncharacterized protein n=1 Tax=Athelia psychrophila TaxID=1759441 RepID=A0A166N8P6_9AGAM|nr:hypothetical protein FIBSPDRAFT_406300 [Fibularhizoctonia sp. CBS 109695]
MGPTLQLALSCLKPNRKRAPILRAALILCLSMLMRAGRVAHAIPNRCSKAAMTSRGSEPVRRGSSSTSSSSCLPLLRCLHDRCWRSSSRDNPCGRACAREPLSPTRPSWPGRRRRGACRCCSPPRALLASVSQPLRGPKYSANVSLISLV